MWLIEKDSRSYFFEIKRKFIAWGSDSAESDETPAKNWIVEVTLVAQIPPLNYSTPAILDVKFEFPRLKQALEVRRFRTATTARGESPTRHNLNTIHLLGHFSFRATCFASENWTSAHWGASTSSNKGKHPRARFDQAWTERDKAHIYERCRIYD